MGDNTLIVALECEECKRRNYSTTKNRQTHKDKIELKKYCRWCKGHRLHKETK